MPASVLTPRRAVVLLALCCVAWGLSFPGMQLALAELGRVDHGHAGVGDELARRATFNAWRFLAATALYAALTWRRQRAGDVRAWRGGTLIGGVFALGLFLQNAGLAWCLPSVSAMLTALSVLLAPLVQRVVLRRPLPPGTLPAVALALIGCAVLGLPNPGAGAMHSVVAVPPLPLLGELLTIAGMLLFTAQILAVDHWGRSGSSTSSHEGTSALGGDATAGASPGTVAPARPIDPAVLTLAMFATTTLVSAAIGLAAGGGRLHSPAVVVSVLADPTFALWSAAIVLFSSVAAFHVMNRAQPILSPATASVVYCLEPLCATLWSVAVATERLTWITALGGALVTAAVLVVARRAR